VSVFSREIFRADGKIPSVTPPIKEHQHDRAPAYPSPPATSTPENKNSLFSRRRLAGAAIWPVADFRQ
jgi:hypothetical protein